MALPKLKLPVTVEVELLDKTDSSALATYVPDLKHMIAAYVQAIETEESNIMCKCQWKLNSLDVVNGLPHEQCRKILDEVSPECPVHTKEGLILGFFQWTMKLHK